MPLLLAQAPPPTSAPGWALGLSEIFWFTLLFIFLAAIVSAIIRLRVRDKCLRLLHDHHVTYLTVAGRALWGDVLVFSQGLELRFDAPYRTTRGLVKCSALIYQPELAQCLAICRLDDALTPPERDHRRRQVRRSFNPGLLRRTGRSIRNLFNTIRDAFSKALSALIGQVSRANPGTAIAAQQTSMDQIGQTLLGALPNAYEPLLERHIGKPVVLELASPADPAKAVVELPGYLVDYSDRFLAVFNVDHTPLETLDLELTASLERPGLKVALTERDVTVTCAGPDVLLVKRYECGARKHDLAVALTNGTFVQMPREPDHPVRLLLLRTRQIDIVCPRALASVRFAGAAPPARGDWLGLAPEFEAVFPLREALRNVLRPRRPRDQ